MLQISSLLRLQSYDTPCSQIRSIGVHLPEKQLDNEELASTINAPQSLRKQIPKLLSRLTGIQTRRYAPKGTPPSDLALFAAQEALKKANLSPHEIDTLIFASTDSDIFEPATANILQQKLNIQAVNSFDVKNACNSVLQAINLANSLIATGVSKRVLIASGEVGSQFCNREIKDLSELNERLGGLTLGDAGAALILEKSNGIAGILEISLLSLAHHWPLCHIPENINWRNEPAKKMQFYLDMKGLAKLAHEKTLQYLEEYFSYRQEKYKEKEIFESIDFVIPHQISKRFIQEIATHFHFDTSKLYIIADHFGNTGSTSILLAIDALLQTNQLRYRSNQELFLYGAASGFSIGHIHLRF